MLSAVDLAAVNPHVDAGTAFEVCGVNLRLLDPATVPAADLAAVPATAPETAQRAPA
jgi:hypothetical protein